MFFRVQEMFLEGGQLRAGSWRWQWGWELGGGEEEGVLGNIV